MKHVLFFIIIVLFSFFTLPKITSTIYAQSCSCHLLPSCDSSHPCFRNTNVTCKGLLNDYCCTTYVSPSLSCTCGATANCTGGYCNICCNKTCACSCVATTTGGYCTGICCDAWHLNITNCPNGCTPSSTGGTCNDYCSSYNQRNCLCGCDPNSTGGTCYPVYNVSSCPNGGDQCTGVCNPYCNKTCTSTQHCVNTSTGGYCVTNTGTPTSTPDPYTCTKISGQYCIFGNLCDYYGLIDGIGSCRPGTTCCKDFPAVTATNTPTSTPPSSCGVIGKPCCTSGTQCTTGFCNTSFTPNLCVDSGCSGIFICQNSKLYPCKKTACINGQCVGSDGVTNLIDFDLTASVFYCLLGCNATITGCNESAYCVDKKCFPATSECPSGQTGNTLDWCWSSYNLYEANYKTNPSYVTCVNTTACSTASDCITNPTPTGCASGDCTPYIDICAADTIVPPCSVRYPGDISKSVEHHDNCYNPVAGTGIGCGPPCAAPTTTGVPCTPDCSSTGSYCLGVWYDDPTGCGRCLGTKSCTGTLTAQSFAISAADTSCANASSWSDSLSGTTFGFSPAVVPASKIQDASSVSWTGVSTDGTTVYTLSSVPAGTYATGNICLSRNGGAWSQASAGSLSDGGTLSFRVGYIPQNGWAQTAVGNVYAATQCTGSVPPTATNPYFSLVGGGGTAGLVTYGTGYDFSLSSSNLGDTDIPPRVSPNGWLIQASYTKVHFYERLKEKLLDQTGVITLSSITDVELPSCATESCIYYANGDTTTKAASSWVIPANKKIIVLVNGNLTINSPITITSGGFFAAIANGNIVVSPSVGGITTDATPHLQGVFVATNATGNAIFATGESTSVGHERLNIKGTVIADSFTLQRDLGAANDSTPGELFTFDPQLLFTMPDTMMDTPYIWQEVAP